MLESTLRAQPGQVERRILIVGPSLVLQLHLMACQDLLFWRTISFLVRGLSLFEPTIDVMASTQELTVAILTGPMLQANVGDTFQVTVTNNIEGPGDGTLLHWHGLNQQGTPYFDGTPSSQLCPIAPGDSFTYTFIADQTGSSWWHSHFSAQHIDGLKGPMIIDG